MTPAWKSSGGRRGRKMWRDARHLGAEVLADGSHVNGGGGANTPVARDTRLEVAVDTTHGELCDQGLPSTNLR